MIPISHYIMVSAVLFTIGLFGVVLRRNLVVLLLSLEILLNAVNLSLVAFSRLWGNLTGQVFVFFVITVAAAEVALGLAILTALYRQRMSIDANAIKSLKL
jgi:NADH-quinone oxidoreductase subunit K